MGDSEYRGGTQTKMVNTGKCEICQEEVNRNVCLCDDCDRVVGDWDKKTNSYKRLDNAGTYTYNEKTGKYELKSN